MKAQFKTFIAGFKPKPKWNKKELSQQMADTVLDELWSETK